MIFLLQIGKSMWFKFDDSSSGLSNPPSMARILMVKRPTTAKLETMTRFWRLKKDLMMPHFWQEAMMSWKTSSTRVVRLWSFFSRKDFDQKSMVFYQNVWYLRVLIKYIMHKTHPSSKKLKDFFKSSIKNESRLYFDCTAVRSRTTFIILVCCRATSGHPIPHADWSKNAWRVISKKENLFSEHLFWAAKRPRAVNVSADGGKFWKNGGNHEFYVFLKLVHHNFPSFPIICQIDKAC